MKKPATLRAGQPGARASHRSNDVARTVRALLVLGSASLATLPLAVAQYEQSGQL